MVSVLKTIWEFLRKSLQSLWHNHLAFLNGSRFLPINGIITKVSHKLPENHLKYLDEWEFLRLVIVTQSHPTHCNTLDCSPPGSPVHGILQARILEWVAVSSLKISEIWLIIPLSYAHHCVTTGQHRSLDYFSLLFAALSVSQQKTGGAPKLGEIQVLLFTKRL